MPKRKRKRSISEPISFSDLTTKLMRHADSFISAFDVSEPRMRQIVGEFHKIVDEVTEMQQTTDEQRREGVRRGVDLIFGFDLIGAVAAAADVVRTNRTKIREERESAHKVEELGKEFMKIVEPLKNDLEEIKRTCEELEKRSAEGQAKRSLSDMEAFQRIVGRVSELRRRTGEVLDVTVTVMEIIHNLFMFIVSVFRVTATPEEDQKLRDSIVQSADQCEKVINAFDQMKKELLDIMEETKSSE